MGRNSATAQRITPSETSGDKVLILAEGDITLRIDGDAIKGKRGRFEAFWPALTVAATLVAMTSTAVTAYTTFSHSDASASIDQRLQQLETRLAGVVDTAGSRSNERMDLLMLQMDDLDGKVDLLPAKIDDASHRVAGSVSDTFLTVKDALNALAPFPGATRPVLVVRRRKAMSARW